MWTIIFRVIRRRSCVLDRWISLSLNWEIYDPFSTQLFTTLTPPAPPQRCGEGPTEGHWKVPCEVTACQADEANNWNICPSLATSQLQSTLVWQTRARKFCFIFLSWAPQPHAHTSCERWKMTEESNILSTSNGSIIPLFVQESLKSKTPRGNIFMNHVLVTGSRLPFTRWVERENLLCEGSPGWKHVDVRLWRPFSVAVEKFSFLNRSILDDCTQSPAETNLCGQLTWRPVISKS